MDALQRPTLPGDERVPVFFLPDLFPDAPHLKNRIVILIRCARLSRVIIQHTYYFINTIFFGFLSEKCNCC
jgi:hypothetical protein